MTLKDALLWAQTVGAGVLAYLVMERWPWACSLPARPKRWLAFALSAAFGLATWGLGLLFQYVPLPCCTWRQWCEAAFGVAAAAIVAAQALHGAIKLPSVR
jgi:hypothetical protein